MLCAALHTLHTRCHYADLYTLQLICWVATAQARSAELVVAENKLKTNAEALFTLQQKWAAADSQLGAVSADLQATNTALIAKEGQLTQAQADAQVISADQTRATTQVHDSAATLHKPVT